MDEYSRNYRLHFAYGIEMNSGYLSHIGITFRRVSIACLPEYEMDFFGYSGGWNGAVASLVGSPGRNVRGVVYRLSFSDAEKLDESFDVRLDGSGTYFHYPANVFDTEGNRYPVMFYKKDQLGERKNPGAHYLRHIVDGAEENGLPPAYCEMLKRTPCMASDFGDHAKLPAMKEGWGWSGTCRECGDLRVGKGGTGFHGD